MIRFQDLNMIHVTVGMLSLLGLMLLLHHAASAGAGTRPACRGWCCWG